MSMPKNYNFSSDKYDDGGGRIEINTDDDELYERIDHYINTLIDAESWRRSLVRINLEV